MPAIAAAANVFNSTSTSVMFWGSLDVATASTVIRRGGSTCAVAIVLVAFQD